MVSSHHNAVAAPQLTYYEAPQVVYNDTKSILCDGKECVIYDNTKCAIGIVATEAPQAIGRDSKEVVDHEYGSADKKGSRKICGLRPQVFWFLVALSAIIVGGILLGVGLGEGLTSRHKNGDAATNGAHRYVLLLPHHFVWTTLRSPRSQNSTVGTTLASSTTPSITSTDTSNAASPSSNALSNAFYLMVYNHPNFTGSSQNYSKIGLYSLGFDADSYIWQPGNSDCCVRFCTNSTNVGYRCTSKTYQANASMPFNKIITECGSTPSPESCAEVCC